MDAIDENKTEEIKPDLKLTPQLAFFRKHYWKKRNAIFNELYKILYDSDKLSDKEKTILDEPPKDSDSDDSFSDIKNYNQKKLKHYESQTLISLLNKDNDIKTEPSNIEQAETEKNEEEDENSESDDNMDFPFNNNFLANTKEKIYKNYLNNYVAKNYKFTKNEFSLSANDFNKKVFFRINGLIIFEINYLIKIKINNRKKEWVCNAYYGLYLLYIIKKCQKLYPIYPRNNNYEIEDINEIKTISNQNDFNTAMSKGVNEFEDKDYQINLDQIIDDIICLNNINLLKVGCKKYLNLNEQVSQIGDYIFLKYLFEKNNLFEEYIYIFGSKNYLNNEDMK